MAAESPDLTVAKRLLNTAKRGGFSFQRVAPSRDGRGGVFGTLPNGVTPSISPGSATRAPPPGPANHP
jgi:hypothetical protein